MHLRVIIKKGYHPVVVGSVLFEYVLQHSPQLTGPEDRHIQTVYTAYPEAIEQQAQYNARSSCQQE